MVNFKALGVLILFWVLAAILLTSLVPLILILVPAIIGLVVSYIVYSSAVDYFERNNRK